MLSNWRNHMDKDGILMMARLVEYQLRECKLKGLRIQLVFLEINRLRSERGTASIRLTLFSWE